MKWKNVPKMILGHKIHILHKSINTKWKKEDIKLRKIYTVDTHEELMRPWTKFYLCFPHITENIFKNK